jgi:hypothetical protein
MTEFEQKLANVDKRIERQRKKMTALHEERSAILEECPHTHIESKSYYYEGGYLNRSYSEHWNQCKTCGAKSAVTTRDGGHYS